MIIKNDKYSPGYHVLMDMWGAQGLSDIMHISKALRETAEICGATIIREDFQSFGEGAGVTGFVMLAESHISIHTWPEIKFAALDIFMCGECDARRAISPLEQMFMPESVEVREYERGKIRHNMS